MLTDKVKEANFAMVLRTAVSQLGKRSIGGLHDSSSPHQSNSLDIKSWKRNIKNCNKDAEVQLSRLMASGGGVVGEGLSLL